MDARLGPPSPTCRSGARNLDGLLQVECDLDKL